MVWLLLVLLLIGGTAWAIVARRADREPVEPRVAQDVPAAETPDADYLDDSALDQPPDATRPATPAAPVRIRATAPVQAAPRPEAPALVTAVVRCPCCDGLGRLPSKRDAQVTVKCPVCLGQRSRTMRYRSAVLELCPECEGMGGVMVYDERFGTYERKRCEICNGKGLVPVRQSR